MVLGCLEKRLLRKKVNDEPDELLTDPENVDPKGLPFLLEQFRHVESTVHEHLKEMDARARGNFSITAVLTAALSLGVGQGVSLIEIPDGWPGKVLLFVFVAGLALTFGAGAYALMLQATYITPNPHSSWREFVSKPYRDVQYTISREMARNHKLIMVVVASKERRVNVSNFGLILQVVVLCVLMLISVIGMEESMSNDPNPPRENAPVKEVPAEATPAPATPSPKLGNPYAGSIDVKDLSFVLKKSTDDEVQTRSEGIEIQKTRKSKDR